jgi:hypothetical protein
MIRCKEFGFAKFFFYVNIVVAMPSCSPGPNIKIDSAYGPGIKFSERGDTFSWAPVNKEDTGDYRADNPQLHDLIKIAVEEQFLGKGYKKSSDDMPDFWINYRLATKNRTDMGSHGPTQNFDEGSLVLDVIDPGTRKLIWRAVAKTRLDNSLPPAVRKERAQTAVKRMLENLPAVAEQPPTS